MIDLPLDKFTPEKLAFDDTSLQFRHVPAPRRVRVGEAAARIPSRVVTIQRCDPHAPAGSPDACVI
jgi:hypothetical protein